jgi:hypothetical protein
VALLKLRQGAGVGWYYASYAGVMRPVGDVTYSVRTGYMVDTLDREHH